MRRQPFSLNTDTKARSDNMRFPSLGNRVPSKSYWGATFHIGRVHGRVHYFPHIPCFPFAVIFAVQDVIGGDETRSHFSHSPSRSQTIAFEKTTDYCFFVGGDDNGSH
jgi:hypothetical protein